MVFRYSLWAVHLADGTVQPAVCWIGLGVAAALMLLGGWGLRDDDVPRVALLTAAFFVAAQIHLRLGPTSVHLLLNGLLGVVLGRRAALAIPLGLLLQALLFAHGGFLTLGINTCIMVAPALLASLLFRAMDPLARAGHRWCEALLVTLTVLGCLLTMVFGVTVLWRHPTSADALAEALAAGQAAVGEPLVLGAAVLGCLGMVVLERKLQLADFAFGLFLGWLTVLVTIVLNFLTLFLAGSGNWLVPAQLMFIGHLPLAVLEGIVLGFTLSFLRRVKPEMLA